MIGAFGVIPTSPAFKRNSMRVRHSSPLAGRSEGLTDPGWCGPGVPLFANSSDESEDGTLAIGALCLIDAKPRERFTADQRNIL